MQCQDFERFRYIHSSLIEKDLFVIYAVDTVRGCKHPIVADLRDFVSFSKRNIRNILRKRYCKANKVDQFAHHIFPPEFRCIWNPRECFPLLVVLQQSKGTQIPREENEGERLKFIIKSYISFVSTKDPSSAIADSIGQTTIAVLRDAIQ